MNYTLDTGEFNNSGRYKLYNYNIINPVNIHYRKYSENENTKTFDENKVKSQSDENQNGGQRRFPNGNKVAIDYTKNSINISQVLQDFRSTISAINTPDDIKEEVESYLNLVIKETDKEAPSKDIILANLKNAARITDRYIQDSLKKPSKVVQDWVDALFLQKINLKPDPNDVNEEFKVKIPDKKSANAYAATNAYAQTQNAEIKNIKPVVQDKVEFNKKEEQSYKVEAQTIEKVEDNSQENYGENIFTVNYTTETFDNFEPKKEIENKKEINPKTTSPYTPRTKKETLAKTSLINAKSNFEKGGDMYSTLKLYDEALEYIEGSDNINLKSAIYFERGKVFESYDYAELALIDYNKATKSTDGNLKTQAHIKMGNIYDDYVQIEPAMVQYTKAIETAEDMNNLQAKTKALRHIAGMFTKMYDKENTETFNDLAIETADETNNKKTIAKTYLEAAKNYSYIGEDSKALGIYSRLAQNKELRDDYDTMAKNYMEASILMEKKGNKKKAYSLLLKSQEYSRLAKLNKSLI